MALIEQAKIGSGQWVLVVAAVGGLGTLLVQLAHTAGAKVTFPLEHAAAAHAAMEARDAVGKTSLIP